jgi:hypothetical protein
MMQPPFPYRFWRRRFRRRSKPGLEVRKSTMFDHLVAIVAPIASFLNSLNLTLFTIVGRTVVVIVKVQW